jgi:hypothetical protein
MATLKNLLIVVVMMMEQWEEVVGEEIKNQEVELGKNKGHSMGIFVLLHLNSILIFSFFFPLPSKSIFSLIGS